MLVYDVTNRKSFEAIDNWIAQIQQHAGGQIDKILVGNKSDMVEKRVVTYEEGAAMARKYDIPFYETSAKKGENVKKSFVEIATIVKNRLGQYMINLCVLLVCCLLLPIVCVGVGVGVVVVFIDPGVVNVFVVGVGGDGGGWFVTVLPLLLMWCCIIIEGNRCRSKRMKMTKWAATQRCSLRGGGEGLPTAEGGV
jgi:hypothetical protein